MFRGNNPLKEIRAWHSAGDGAVLLISATRFANYQAPAPEPAAAAAADGEEQQGKRGELPAAGGNGATGRVTDAEAAPAVPAKQRKKGRPSATAFRASADYSEIRSVQRRVMPPRLLAD